MNPPNTPAEPYRSLASPTSMGQTAHLVKLDGAVVAAVCWERLPYYTRTVWGSRVDAIEPRRVKRFLQRDASPVALLLATRSERLSDALRQLAQARLAETGLGPEALRRLERHFEKLIKRSRSMLLKHLSVAERADPVLDRLDLLAEIVALRDVQADVQVERSLARAFRAMFQTRDPFLIWVLVCLSFGIWVVFVKVQTPTTAQLYSSLVLPPDLSRPWTLLTYSFLHILDDWRHVVLNMVSLIFVGQVLEQVLGHLRFLLTYLLSAVGGGIVSILYRTTLDLPFVTVGASGAISGLAGMALFLGLWFQSRYGRIPLRYSTSTLVGGFILVSNVLLSATSGSISVDHGAHIGGLLVGVAIGVWARPVLARRADARFGRGELPR